MALKLHGLPVSTCTARALVTLNEKEVEYELVPVDLMSGEHKKAPYLSKNPFGQIPVLEDGSLTLFESRAISSYVAEKFKDQGTDLIRHENLKEAATVKVWLEVEAQHYNPIVSTIVFQLFFAPRFGKTTDQAVVDANIEKLKGVLDVYETRLSSTKYLAGDFYSLADAHHFPYTHYFMMSQYASVVNERPHVKAWWEDISSRPAIKKVADGIKF